MKNLNLIEADLRPEFIKRRDDPLDAQIPAIVQPEVIPPEDLNPAQNFNLFEFPLQSPVAC